MVQKPRWMLCFRDLYFLHTLIFTETMTKQSLSRSSGTAQAENLMILWHLTIFDSLFLNSKENKEAQNPSKYLLYQDPMLGIF